METNQMLHTMKRTALLVLSTAMLALSTQAGQTLYAIGNGVGDGSSNLYRIDNYGSAPAAVSIGEAGVKLFDVAVDPTSGRIYALDNSSMFYELNPTSGVASVIGPMGVASQNALVFDQTGQAFSWGSVDRHLYRVNKATGATTLIGDTGFKSGGDLAFDVDGTLYGSTGTQLIQINPTNGVGAAIGSFGTSGVYGMAIDTYGSIYAAAGSDSTGTCDLYGVNKATGVATLIGSVAGSSSYGVYGLSFTVAPGPIFISISQDPAGVKLGWNSQVGALYRLQSCQSLNTGEWADLGGQVSGNGSTNYVTDSVETNASRYYRVGELP
jgi:hypothetical protein